MSFSSPKSRASSPKRRASRQRAGGFTLIEAALSTVIIGTGVLAIIAAQQAYHMKNNWATRTSTAMLLANELRERTLTLPLHDPITGDTNLGAEPDENAPLAYDDLDDFAGTVVGGVGSGASFNPPINALGLELGELDRWTQTIKVENVLPDYIDATFTQPLGTTDIVRVTVTVLYRDPSTGVDKPITEMSWIVTAAP